MRIFLHIIAILVITAGWILFIRSKSPEQGAEGGKPGVEQVNGEDQPERQARRTEIEKEGEAVFNGMLMSFLTAGYIGVVFVVYLLPGIAHRFTHAVYDSGEMVEDDPMHDARALVAQGDYPGAIEAFKHAFKQDSTNRLPWVEIIKIQRENLEDSDAAIATVRDALENYAWDQRDAAYFLFRLSELYDEDKDDRMSAANILQQVVDQFPETRHSANARHKLHEWGLV